MWRVVVTSGELRKSCKAILQNKAKRGSDTLAADVVHSALAQQHLTVSPIGRPAGDGAGGSRALGQTRGTAR